MSKERKAKAGRKCGADKTDGSGDPCEQDAGWGTSHPGFGQCKFHSGSTPNGEKSAARQAMFAMAVEADAEPHEVLLKTIRIAWGGVLGIQEKLVGIDIDDPEISVGQLKSFALWQQIYGEWTDRAAKYAKMALAAGVEERKVRVAEAEGALLADVIKAILGDLELTKAQQALAGPAVRRHLMALTA